MSHLHYDSAAVDAALKASHQQLAAIAAGNNSAAAQARMTISVMAAFTRQIAEEQNRGTDAKLISDALAAVSSNMIRSFVATFGPQEAEIEQVAALIGFQVNKTLRFLSLGVSGNAEGPSFEIAGQPGGRA